MNISLIQGDSPSAHTIHVGPLILVFSYETCVAFATRETGWVVSENVWSKTTGKHLNQECPAVDRVPYEDFRTQLDTVLSTIKIEESK